MLERVPTVLTAKEILDMAFQRSGRLEIKDPDRYHRIRKTFGVRMDAVVDITASKLEQYPKAIGSLDKMRPYETEVLDILVGLPRLRKALGSIAWAAEKIRRVGQETNQKMLRVRREESQFHTLQKQLYGRVASLVDEVDPALEVMAEARAKLKALPSISPDYATIVIAGYPNVGKTSLLRQWTRSKAAIDQYSFTTKKAEVGHFDITDEHGVETRYQIVDTPGLLDRPDEDRNDIERQATAAVRHVADAVLFIIDPSETSGYSAAQQEALLEQVASDMEGIPLLVAESKADIYKTDSDRPRFSTHTGEGLDDLKAQVLALVQFEEGDLAMDPLDRWKQPAETDVW